MKSIESNELKKTRNNAESAAVVNLENQEVLTRIIEIIIKIHNLKVSLLVSDESNDTF